MANKSRPKIPAELKRQILVEAGHRCAIPTCRVLSPLEIAHIEKYSKVKEHKYENLIVLCRNCHGIHHEGKIDKKSLYMYKDNLRYFVEKYSKFELDLLFELSRLPSNNGLPFQGIYYLLIKRLLEETFVQIIQKKGGVFMSGIKMDPDIVVITPQGKEFIASFKKTNIGYKSN